MATKSDDKKPRKLPKKFRASSDSNEAAAFAILQENDERQQELLGEKINAPYTVNTPLERLRSKAYITIRTLEASGNFDEGTLERLAECYATIGRYDTAAQISEKNAELYRKYWDAVWLDDALWCDHAEQHKYVKEHVFSFREMRELPMLACNLCGTWNVADTTYQLDEKQRREDKIRTATKKMDKDATFAYLKQHVKPA